MGANDGDISLLVGASGSSVRFESALFAGRDYLIKRILKKHAL